MNSTEYVLNAIAWTLGGAAVSSVYWRIYFHRKLVALGAAQKEPLADVLAVPPDSGTRTRVLATVQAQIASDRTRLNKIQNNPLQPVTDCVRAKAQ
jgi:hypothetical protein